MYHFSLFQPWKYLQLLKCDVTFDESSGKCSHIKRSHPQVTSCIIAFCNTLYGIITLANQTLLSLPFINNALTM